MSGPTEQDAPMTLPRHAGIKHTFCHLTHGKCMRVKQKQPPVTRGLMELLRLGLNQRPSD